jgi:AraC family transcriptional activator of pobA
MNKPFTLEEFYREYFPTCQSDRFLVSSQLGHINVFERGVFCKQLAPFSRRDYFKISLIEGCGLLHYTDKTVEVTGHALVFYNPSMAYSWDPLSEKQGGYFCLFNSSFLAPVLNDVHVKNSALFNAATNPVYNIDEQQAEELGFIFRQMNKELESSYAGKYDVLRHYLQLFIHEANKMQPAHATRQKYLNASSRIASLFIELLERQFPVDSTEHALKLKSPVDFAGRLSVHVNHLNRAVKEVSGKNTTELIAARVASEAKSLLQHTNNSVAEIAYSLGFEHASNFNVFFKKQTGYTPLMVRSAQTAQLSQQMQNV